MQEDLVLGINASEQAELNKISLINASKYIL